MEQHRAVAAAATELTKLFSPYGAGASGGSELEPGGLMFQEGQMSFHGL